MSQLDQIYFKLEVKGDYVRLTDLGNTFKVIDTLYRKVTKSNHDNINVNGEGLKIINAKVKCFEWTVLANAMLCSLPEFMDVIYKIRDVANGKKNIQELEDAELLFLLTFVSNILFGGMLSLTINECVLPYKMLDVVKRMIKEELNRRNHNE